MEDRRCVVVAAHPRQMYGAELTNGNAERVLCRCAPVIALLAAEDPSVAPPQARGVLVLIDHLPAQP
jgi:hypothetical protein